MPAKLIEREMRTENLPHIWCPGCSHGSTMRALCQAIENAGLERKNTIIVSGIGCSSRAVGYLNFDTIHTTHGRALAFATGIKLAKPELNVIVLTGDGDISAIGGNHLIHACRRNIGITCIVLNNNIYGMTGGQYSPTTPSGDYATTAPYGNIDRDFDIPLLAKSAGATFTARVTAYGINEAIKIMEKAIRHKGFSVVDVASICPSYYGRKNKKGDAVKMLQWQRDNSVPVKAAEKMSKEELQGKIITGIFNDEQYPEYTDEYEKIIERAGGR
ncbi:MAG: 2-oxoacid:ferredoxin oxidoreductase subunit beta [Erysipelotrichaceae bacterium]|nr:2-oxoacid:ferredoxin oxidoreductase subunit beta [Erysipelotrichaceae bacterium]